MAISPAAPQAPLRGLRRRSSVSSVLGKGTPMVPVKAVEVTGLPVAEGEVSLRP